MGEAKVKEEATKVGHDILVGWVQRALMLTTLRGAQGKGPEFSATMRDCIKAFKLDDDWDYLEDGGNILRPPSYSEYAVGEAAVVEAVKETLTRSEIEGQILAVLVRVRQPRECPDRIVHLTNGMISFCLKHVRDDGTLKGMVIEKLGDLFDDLDDAKAGKYELPEEVRPLHAVKSLPEPTEQPS